MFVSLLTSVGTSAPPSLRIRRRRFSAIVVLCRHLAGIPQSLRNGGPAILRIPTRARLAGSPGPDHSPCPADDRAAEACARFLAEASLPGVLLGAPPQVTLRSATRSRHRYCRRSPVLREARALFTALGTVLGKPMEPIAAMPLQITSPLRRTDGTVLPGPAPALVADVHAEPCGTIRPEQAPGLGTVKRRYPQWPLA
jgi:hypothetical protein